MRIRRNLVGDQAVERRTTSAAGSSLPHVGSPKRGRRTSRGVPSSVFLSRASAAHAASRSTRTGFGSSCFRTAASASLVARELERRDHPERDGLPVRERVAGRRLERVPERVTEVELVARAAVVRVGEQTPALKAAHRRTSSASGSSHTGLAHEEARLHDLGHPVPMLGVRQRLERARVDRRRAPASGRRRRGSCRPAGRRPSCRRLRRRPGRRALSAPPPRRRRACTSPRRSRRRRSCSRRRGRRSSRRGRSGASARAARARRSPSPARPEGPRGEPCRARRARAAP